MTDEPPTDLVKTRILDAVVRSQAGDAESARSDFAAMSALPGDGYGAVVRSGVDRVAALLDGG